MVLRFCSANMLRFESVISYTMIFTPRCFKEHDKTTTRKSMALKNNNNLKKEKKNMHTRHP